MTKFIILSSSDVLSLFHNKPVKLYVDQIPHILCTGEYYENIKDKSTDTMDGHEDMEEQLKDLSERVENIENQMKEDKDEQLKKLKAELDYAKFCCRQNEVTNKYYF